MAESPLVPAPGRVAIQRTGTPAAAAASSEPGPGGHFGPLVGPELSGLLNQQGASVWNWRSDLPEQGPGPGPGTGLDRFWYQTVTRMNWVSAENRRLQHRWTLELDLQGRRRSRPLTNDHRHQKFWRSDSAEGEKGTQFMF